jgi:hypothetical protein
MFMASVSDLFMELFVEKQDRGTVDFKFLTIGCPLSGNPSPARQTELESRIMQAFAVPRSVWKRRVYYRIWI